MLRQFTPRDSNIEHVVKKDIKVLGFDVEEIVVSLEPNRPQKSSNKLLPEKTLSSLEGWSKTRDGNHVVRGSHWYHLV
uniref:Uncharacterized protein n=1 Tax=Cucumis melo TaxID=3656 RepID=A0A9I9DTU0_CUCME